MTVFARLFAGAVSRRMRGVGVMPAWLVVLLCLLEEDGLTEADLARRLSSRPKTIADAVRQLQDEGLVRRSPARADGAARLAVSWRVRTLGSLVEEATRDAAEAALASLGEEDGVRLRDLLERAGRNLERESDRWPS